MHVRLYFLCWIEDITTLFFLVGLPWIFGQWGVAVCMSVPNHSNFSKICMIVNFDFVGTISYSSPFSRKGGRIWIDVYVWPNKLIWPSIPGVPIACLSHLTLSVFDPWSSVVINLFHIFAHYRLNVLWRTIRLYPTWLGQCVQYFQRLRGKTTRNYRECLNQCGRDGLKFGKERREEVFVR